MSWTNKIHPDNGDGGSILKKKMKKKKSKAIWKLVAIDTRPN